MLYFVWVLRGIVSYCVCVSPLTYVLLRQPQRCWIGFLIGVLIGVLLRTSALGLGGRAAAAAGHGKKRPFVSINVCMCIYSPGYFRICA